MTFLRRALPRLWALGHRPEIDRDLDEELAFHLEMEALELERAGLSREEARSRARARFGGVEKAREEVRDQWRWRWIEELLHDLRLGARTLARSPGFSAAAILTLALGLGANTAIFSVVHGVLLAPLPYAHGERLVVLRQHAPRLGIEDVGLSIGEIADYRAASTLDGVVEYHSMWFNLLGRGEPLRVQTGVVSAGFFDLFGVEPQLGRGFVPEDEEHDAEPVLLLSHRFWLREFGGDPTVVGASFEMNDRPHTVIGVLPPVPQYPDDNDVYMPTVACPFRMEDAEEPSRSRRSLLAFARLRPGISAPKAAADLGRLADGFATRFPEEYPAGSGFGIRAIPLRDLLAGSARGTLLVLLGTVALVLVAASANVASLSLARLISRERDLALRAALGASRGRTLRQLVTESTLVALAGSAVGLLLAWAGQGMLVQFARRFSPRADEIGLDPAVLAFAVGAAVVTGVLIGLLSTLHVSRHNVAERLRRGAGGAVDGSGGRFPGQGLRGFLVISQLAVTVVLLTAAGLLGRSLVKLQQVDPGFDADNVLTARLSLDWSKYRDGESMLDFYRRLEERIAASPWVRSLALASSAPLTPGSIGSSPFEIVGDPALGNRPRPRTRSRRISTGFLDTLGIPILAGRGFELGDRGESAEVALINRSLRDRHFGERDPLGQKIRFTGSDIEWRIVGVVADFKQDGLASDVQAEVFIPLAQAPGLNATLLVRSSLDPARLEREVRREVYRIDPEQPVFSVATMAARRREALAPPRLTSLLMALFAGLTLAITLTGIAGLLAFTVSRRRREIGVRMALGADRRQVIGMILRQGLTLVGVGMAVGLAAGLLLTRLLAGLLYEVESSDPLTYVAASLLLLAVAALACWLPAQRASAIDPMVVLKDG